MKETRFTRYAEDVVKMLNIKPALKRRIKEDLLATLVSKAEETGIDDPYKLMGDPQVVAEEWRENLGRPINIVPTRLEYRSKLEIFGIPFVHMVWEKNKVAKGIIAIGPIALGVIAIGGIGIGLISLAALSMGIIFSLGSISVSALYAFGIVNFSLQLAAGVIAISNNYACGVIAVAHKAAIGVIAKAPVAIGVLAKGHLVFYDEEGAGTILYKMPQQLEFILAEVKRYYPEVVEFVQKVLSIIPID